MKTKRHRKTKYLLLRDTTMTATCLQHRSWATSFPLYDRMCNKTLHLDSAWISTWALGQGQTTSMRGANRLFKLSIRTKRNLLRLVSTLTRLLEAPKIGKMRGVLEAQSCLWQQVLLRWEIMAAVRSLDRRPSEVSTLGVGVARLGITNQSTEPKPFKI